MCKKERKRKNINVILSFLSIIFVDKKGALVASQMVQPSPQQIRFKPIGESIPVPPTGPAPLAVPCG